MLAYLSVTGVKSCNALWSDREELSISGKVDSVAFGARPVELGTYFAYEGGREERKGGRYSMVSLGFASVSSSKTGSSWGLRGISLGSSKTVEDGVDSKLKEGEGVALYRGELPEDAGSPKSGRYGLLWVFMGDDGDGRELYASASRLL